MAKISLKFPNVVIGTCAKDYILESVQKEVANEIASGHLFSGLGVVNVDNVVDRNVTKAFWAAPGSCKNLGTPYVVTAVFDGESKITLRSYKRLAVDKPNNEARA